LINASGICLTEFSCNSEKNYSLILLVIFCVTARRGDLTNIGICHANVQKERSRCLIRAAGPRECEGSHASSLQMGNGG